jgi:hypothetical protein
LLPNNHFSLEGKHAVLSPSQWRWINDSETELLERVARSYIPELGTQLHDVARKRIKHKVRLKKHDRDSVLVDVLDNGVPRVVFDYINFNAIYENLMNYVNDCIGYGMYPEVVLAYSDKCFGTADAWLFKDKEKHLMIFDLKTGSTPAHMEQLLCYAALFCLEYRKKPSDISIDLRIYQSGEIIEAQPVGADILPVMDKIVSFDKLIHKEG